MNNTLYMSDTFERQKNVKATAVTLGVVGVLLLIMILYKWPLPTLYQPLIQELIEVNLGNSDVGSGNDQPLLPGEPAPSKHLAYSPPAPVHAREDNVKDVETDDKNVDAPEIKKPSITKQNATKIDNDNKSIKTNNKPQTVVTQAPPKPKAVLGRTTGGDGIGGNGADSYKKGTGEGIAGGNGDQGRPGGAPGGKDYTGTPKNFGVRVLQISNQSFEDEFNENAKVALEVTADEKGRVLSAIFNLKNSTTNNRSMVDIARRKAFELKLGTSDAGQKGIVIFNFKLKS